MMLIAGVVPDNNLPLTCGDVSFSGNGLVVDGRYISCTQGTGAMVSTALTTALYFKEKPPRVVLAGDIGKGEGSRAIYEYLIENVSKLAPEVLALHYWLPDISLMKRLIAAVNKCAVKPLLIADAASMYTAKAAGLAPDFDIFTPDAAETAFLADPFATHPAYVKFMAYNATNKMPEIIADVYKNKNGAKFMLVKGATDYIVKDGNILEIVLEPDVPAMEPIGGTGDTITGMVTAFVAAGLGPHEAMIIAAKANRMAGKMAAVTPASRVNRIIEVLPEVFKQYLCEWSGVCIRKE
jgi:ADP-dependent NAD(P)H-hydrate dehydratase / NAD(P)H-hydrate epimerase